MVEKSKWIEITESNPDHSAWYIERFESMKAAGDDLAGEARFVDAMVARRSRILDAGCGPGRVSAILAELGHDVVGVDVDPELIAAAREADPTPTWVVGDLAELDLDTHGISSGFDVVLAVGNVMPFLAPTTRQAILVNLRGQLVEGGRLVVGFGSGRGYDFAEFLTDAGAAGLGAELTLSTWDLRPFTDESDFLVAILVPAGSAID